MATNKGKGIEKESPKQPENWVGRYTSGKWYCDCNRRARCFTTTKPGPTHGKKFWTCPKRQEDQCPFFLWVEQEAEAIEWLEKSGPQPGPETPTRKGQQSNDQPTPATVMSNAPKVLETPFTKAKRKAVSREASDEQEKDDLGNQNPDAGESYMPENTALDTPSRKAAKTTKFSTPGHSFNEKIKAGATSLPTPDTGNKSKDDPRTSDREISPTPARLQDAINLRGERNSDLTTDILRLLRSDKVELKESTEIQIRHKIDLESDLNRTKVQRCEATISRLVKRLDELETTVGLLTGGDETVELSD